MSDTQEAVNVIPPQMVGGFGKMLGDALVCTLLSVIFTAFAYGSNGTKEILTPEERLWLTSNQSRVVLAVETGYAPFVFIDSKSQPTGLAHDYILLIESKLGTHFMQERFSSLDEIFKKVRSGEAHIVNAVTPTPSRAKFINFTDSFVSVPNVIIVRKERSGQMRESDLSGLRVALVKSYAVTENLTNKNLGFSPDLVPDDLTALLNVSFGRADAAVTDLATASYLITQKGITNLRVAGEVAFGIRLSMGTPIDEPMLHNIIQKGLGAITDAERQEIHKRWINTSSQSIFSDQRFWIAVGSLLVVVLIAITAILIWNRTLRKQVALRTKALERANRLYVTLSETNKAIARINDRDELLQAACRIAVELGKLKMVWIALRDPKTGCFELAASYGLPEEKQNMVGGILCEECLKSDASAIGNDCKGNPSAAWDTFAPPQECLSLTCSKLYQGGQPIGVFMLCAGEANFFDETELSLVHEMATDLSLAIDSLDRDHMLIQQSRLAAMGEMIGNIAHQWRQPINALALLLANIKDAYEFNELTKELLESEVAQGQKMIQKMSSTIDDFRNFFKPNKEKQNFPVSDGVDEAIKLVSESFRNHNIEVTLSKSAAPCAVSGYPNEFAQVALNALSNAKDAIIEKKLPGKVHIRFEQGTDTATVSIRDNGGGIPAEILPKVFDPYFTTKEKGTGIGLYMSKMIMDNMGGNIAIRNVDGGAEVLLTLPLAEHTV